eukprot:scaffold3743_cov389-Prasinococcus_capsulatus_cf.AAC.10
MVRRRLSNRRAAMDASEARRRKRRGGFSGRGEAWVPWPGRAGGRERSRATRRLGEGRAREEEEDRSEPGEAGTHGS